MLFDCIQSIKGSQFSFKDKPIQNFFNQQFVNDDLLILLFCSKYDCINSI